MTKLRKTIRAKIHNLTGIKKQILQREYDRFQEICQEVSAAVDWDFLQDKPYFMFKTPGRYSSYIWGAIKTISGKKQFAKIGEQPLYLRNDTFKIESSENKISKHWLKLPTKEKQGAVWLPITIPEKYEYLLEDKICDSKITKDRKGNWFVNITIQKEVEDIQIPKNPQIIAVDFGERRIATSVEFVGGAIKHPKIYGKDVRGIRRHYNWLRKRLGRRKLLNKIKEIGSTEKRKINDSLHKISRAIVNNAKQLENPVIVIGDLKGIRKGAKNKGKRFNRIVSSMPHDKLGQYLIYKAGWEGIPVIKVSEKNTSKKCSHCGNIGIRLKQSVFNCDCGIKDYNADINGASNIAKRGFAGISGEMGQPDCALNFRGDPNG